MPKVSVIIPVYNTEKYLQKCLDSVCNQTLFDLEIICINDCSTDDSLKILRNYAAKDKRVKIISFELNKGAPIARNTGINEAQGEYIGFVDSDDFVDSDFYEKLYLKAKETGADVVKGNYKDNTTGFVDLTLNEKIKECKTNFVFTYCSGIYNKNLITKYNIKFPEISDMEDPVFAFNVGIRANVIEILDDTFVRICQRNDSITKRLPLLNQIKDKIKGLNLILEMANNASITPESYGFITAFWFSTIIQDSLSNKNPDIEELLFYEMAKIFDDIKYKEEFKSNLDKFSPLLYEHFKKNDFSYLYKDECLKKLVDECEIISFDIFDTLLIRPFIRPTDVFMLLEQITGNQGYAFKRAIAEKRSRIIKQFKQKDFEDVTIDEIYNCIESQFKDLKTKELEIEYQTLQKNNEMFKIYEYALQQGKKVIITSDMYLPSAFLQEVLVKNGYKDFSKLYVSNEYGMTKGSGNLFKQIIKDCNVLPSKILHVGDNINADVKSPQALGLKTFYYKQIKERFGLIFSNIKFFETYNLLENKHLMGAFIGFIIYNWHNNRFDQSYWENLGFILGGPLCYFFLQATMEIADLRNLSDLFFVARDGYILNHVYEKIKKQTDPKNHYIYASRKVKSLCIKVSDDEDLYNKETAEEYVKYADSITLEGENIGIVDTCAGKFSAQTLIETYFKNNNFIGIYLATDLNYKYNYINLSCKHNNNKDCGFVWDLIEVLLCSNENPIENIKNCKPIYREKLTTSDAFSKSFFNQLLKGEENFCTTWVDIFNNISINISIKQIFSYIKIFWQNLDSTDRLFLSKIKHPVNTRQNLYIPITATEEERGNLIKTDYKNKELEMKKSKVPLSTEMS